jgi:DNA polymerase III alpha subunit
MSDVINDIFKARLSITESAGELHKYGEKYQKNSTAGQMSLFGSNDVTLKPTIKQFSGEVNKLQMSISESELIGVCVSYDYSENYLLHRIAYETHSVAEVVTSTIDIKKAVIIGLVKDITHGTSKSGNKYDKIHIYDNGTAIDIFISGNKYREYSGFFYKNTMYLFQLSVSGGGRYINLIASIHPDKLDPIKKFNSVRLLVRNVNQSRSIRNYVHKNMFGSGKKSLKFIIDDSEFEVEYLVNISNKNIIDLKKMNCDVELE